MIRAEEGIGKIYGAIRREDVEMARAALATDTNAVNYVGEKKYTLLFFAAEHGSSNGTEIVKLLIAGGAKVDARNHIGQTPLMLAAIQNNSAGANVLIANGAKVNVHSDGGMLPLHYAALNGCCEVARILIGHNAEVNARTSAGETPLALAMQELKSWRKDGDAAVIKRYEETVSLLRQSGANR